jgi:hypothetical protein
MVEKNSGSYPMLPAKSWWVIRQKFQTKLPNEVTGSYLASILGTSEESAQTNVLRFLKPF